MNASTKEEVPSGGGSDQRQHDGDPTSSPLASAGRGAIAAPVKRSIYHKTIRVAVTTEDAQRGHVDASVDVYRLLRLFGVTDHNLGHAIKKLLVPGQRSGGKSAEQDIAEAIWTLRRWEEMNREDKATKTNNEEERT